MNFNGARSRRLPLTLLLFLPFAAHAADFYVNGATGNDSNSGTASSPIKTIQRGVDLANTAINANQDARVFVAAGVYREAVDFGGVSNTARSFLLEAASGAILSGADVWNSGWTLQSDGTYAHAWTDNWGFKALPNGWDGYWNADGKGYIRDRLRRYEAVFINDQPLFNRLSRSELNIPGTFFVDETADKIYVRPYDSSGFATATIEVATRLNVARIAGRHHLTVRGLQVEKGRGAVQDSIFLVTDSQDLTFENMTVRLAAYSGFGLCCSARTNIRNSKFIDNGVYGTGDFKGITTLLEDSLIARNNWRGWDASHPGWDSVFKWGGTRDGIIRRTDFVDNWGSGLWPDTDNKNLLIDQVFSARNKGAGFWLEANQGPITVQNSVSCQNETGVAYAYSNNVSLINDQIFDNTARQIGVGGTDQPFPMGEWDTGQTITLNTTGHVYTGNTIVGSNPGLWLVQGPYGTQYLTGWRLSYKGDNNRWFHRQATVAFALGNNSDGKEILVDFPTWRANYANYSGNVNKNNEANSTWADPGSLACVKAGAPADTISPTVSINSPLNGTTITGIIPVSASASDNVAVAAVQFKVDGNLVGIEILGAPYYFNWNSNSVSNGNHVLTAVARDTAGRQTTSASINVTVNNSVAPATYRDLILNTAPVGYWRFEETSGRILADDSANGKLGQAHGAYILNVSGLISGSNSGIAFDGVNISYADFGSVHTAAGDNAWSWEVWTQIDAVNQATAGVFGTGNNPRFIIETDRRVGFQASYRDGAWAGGPFTTALGPGLHHLVLTVTGATTVTPVARIYMDGALATTYTYTKPIHSPWSRGTAGDLVINVRDSVYAIKGTFDEAAAYDFALSAAQVKAHYDFGKNGPPASGSCDVSGDGLVNISDVQVTVNAAIGVSVCGAVYDINKDSVCNIVDVQRVVNAALGGACVSP